MRPIVPPAPVHSVIRLVGAGGYRMLLACRVIGAILITLGVIGLAGGLAIKANKLSKISENYIILDWTGRDPGALQISPKIRTTIWVSTWTGDLVPIQVIKKNLSGQDGQDPEN